MSSGYHSALDSDVVMFQVVRRHMIQIQMPLEARQLFPSHSGRAAPPPSLKVPLGSLGRSALETSGAQALSQAGQMGNLDLHSCCDLLLITLVQPGITRVSIPRPMVPNTARCRSGLREGQRDESRSSTVRQAQGLWKPYPYAWEQGRQKKGLQHTCPR